MEKDEMINTIWKARDKAIDNSDKKLIEHVVDNIGDFKHFGRKPVKKTDKKIESFVCCSSKKQKSYKFKKPIFVVSIVLLSILLAFLIVATFDRISDVKTVHKTTTTTIREIQPIKTVERVIVQNTTHEKVNIKPGYDCVTLRLPDDKIKLNCVKTAG